jgi:LEA14-like dessication related protein
MKLTDTPVIIRRLAVPAAAVVLLLAACAVSVKAPEVRLRSIDPKSADTTFVGLEIINPNRFPLRVMSVDYDVSIGDRPCGRGRRSEMLFLDARDTALADFPVVVDYAELLKAIPALLTDSVVFNVKGRYVVSTFVGPRRFGFSGDRKVAVQDVVKSFIEGMFEN